MSNCRREFYQQGIRWSLAGNVNSENQVLFSSQFYKEKEQKQNEVL